MPPAALLLIDMQKAFTTGSWANHFGGPKEVEDIERAGQEAVQLLRSGRLKEMPILRPGGHGAFEGSGGARNAT